MSINSDLLTIFEYYCELTDKDDRLYNIGEVFNYYYAESVKSNILARSLIKIDIKAAFPTLCNLIFENDKEFLNKLNSIDDKLERNIFISNTLKNRTEKNYLIELNNYSKIVVFAYIFNNYDDITVFEFQKDGVLFSGTKVFDKKIKLKNILEKYFKFHIDKVDMYLRFEKTSLYYNQLSTKIEFKGMLKSPPIKLQKIITEVISNPYKNLNFLKEIYNDEYLDVCIKLHIHESLNEYFKFNNYFLNIFGERVKDVRESWSFAPMKFFLYPIISMLRLE